MTGRLPTVDLDSGVSSIIHLITSHKYFGRAKTLACAFEHRLGAILLKMIDPDLNRRPVDYGTIIADIEAA